MYLFPDCSEFSSNPDSVNVTNTSLYPVVGFLLVVTVPNDLDIFEAAAPFIYTVIFPVPSVVVTLLLYTDVALLFVLPLNCIVTFFADVFAFLDSTIHSVLYLKFSEPLV